jgi:hypothetical protein
MGVFVQVVILLGGWCSPLRGSFFQRGQLRRARSFHLGDMVGVDVKVRL